MCNYHAPTDVPELAPPPRMSNLEPDPPPSLDAIEQVRREVASGNWPPLMPSAPPIFPPGGSSTGDETRAWLKGPHGYQPPVIAELAERLPGCNEDYPRVFNPDGQVVRYPSGGVSMPFPPPPGSAVDVKGPGYHHDYRALQNSQAAREAMAKQAEVQDINGDHGPRCVCMGCVTARQAPAPKGLTVAELRELLGVPNPAASPRDGGVPNWVAELARLEQSRNHWAAVALLALFTACLALGGVIGMAVIGN